MKIIDRLASGLFEPKRVIAYKNDSRLFTFLYILILIIVMCLPNIIVSFSRGELSYSEEQEIKDAFPVGKSIPYEIVDNTLVYIGDGTEKDVVITISGVQVLFSDTTLTISDAAKTQDSSSTYYIALYKDGIYIVSYLSSMKVLSYADYQSLNGLDFTKAKLNNNVFWDQLFTTIDSVINNNISFIRLVMIFSLLINGMLLIGGMSLLFTAFSRFGMVNDIPFSKHWQLMIYIMTPLVFGNVLRNLFGIELLYYIGLFMTLIYSFFLNQSQNVGGKNGI